MAKNNQGGDGGATAVTLVFKVDLHCEGCAQKLKKSLKHITGVDSVKADYATNKVTVVGKVDPTVVKNRIEEKMKKTVELVSPPSAAKNDKDGGGKKPDEKPEKKTSDIKKAKEVQIVVLKTNVHCDGCVDKMNKIIKKYQGVETVKVELSKDQITVKGTMDMKKMLPYLVGKFKRPVEVVSPPEKKADGGGEGKSKEGGKAAGGGGGEGGGVVENVYKMEYNGYPYYGYETHVYDPRPQQVAPQPEYGYGYGHVAEYGHAAPYLHAPQMFSDENPNACSIM